MSISSPPPNPSLTDVPLALILRRYLSVLLFVIGNYLYWAGGGFSDSLCRKFWFIPVIVKCTRLSPKFRRFTNLPHFPGLQAMVVQVILGWR